MAAALLTSLAAMRNLRLSLSVLILVALAGNPSFAQSNGAPRKPFLDNALSGDGQPNDLLHVIVKHRPGASTRVRSRLAGQVDRIKREHRGIGALAVELRRGNLDAVCNPRRNPDALGCSVDGLMGPTQTVSAEPAPAPSTASSTTSESTFAWTYDAQNLQATLGISPWNMGWGVGVAVIDSGIAPTWDLAYRVTAFYDFTAGGVAAPMSDAYGHGTHVAGLIAGDGSMSYGKYVGVATGAHLIGLKVLDAQGQGYTSDVIAALEFATANRAALGIDIINLSLGHPIFESPVTDPLVQAVERAVAAGIVVVASAGNWGLNPVTGEIGYAGITSPGNAPSALTVGALRTKATADRSDDEVALFSSRGPTWYTGRVKPDIVAPGQALVAINDPSTTLYQNPLLHADVEPYIKLSGTSMAAAVATGVVALVIEANWQDEWYLGPPLTPNTIKALLQYTALPVPQTFTGTGIPSALAEGAGGINAAGAMALARAIDPAMPLGQPWLDAAVLAYSEIAGVTYSWAQHIVWGDHVVWGDTVTWNRLAWAQHIVWGDDDGVVWGDSLNIVAGTNLVRDGFSVWSQHVVWGDGLVTGLDDGVVWGDLNNSSVVR